MKAETDIYVIFFCGVTQVFVHECIIVQADSVMNMYKLIGIVIF